MTQTSEKIRDYAILGTLGQNREGGRITRLAQAPDGSKVVIKEFRFVDGSKWDEYNEIAREIDILKNLDHPRIPKFIDSFETEQGACLVQEYINAPNLDQRRTFSIEQIVQLAKDLLEILVYLQSLTPPVLHRDIKPGNLLLDAQDNLYLVDFGFSRIGLEDVAVSSMVRGTTGFMPPEQMLGLDLSKASDLYSVGATLVCLILGIPSGRMAQLIDIGENRLKFREHLLDDMGSHFTSWLQRLTEPRAGDRFKDAAEALKGFESKVKAEVNRSLENIPAVNEQPQVGQYEFNIVFDAARWIHGSDHKAHNRLNTILEELDLIQTSEIYDNKTTDKILFLLFFKSHKNIKNQEEFVKILRTPTLELDGLTPEEAIKVFRRFEGKIKRLDILRRQDFFNVKSEITFFTLIEKKRQFVNRESKAKDLPIAIKPTRLLLKECLSKLKFFLH